MSDSPDQSRYTTAEAAKALSVSYRTFTRLAKEHGIQPVAVERKGKVRRNLYSVLSIEHLRSERDEVIVQEDGEDGEGSETDGQDTPAVSDRQNVLQLLADELQGIRGEMEALRRERDELRRNGERVAGERDALLERAARAEQALEDLRERRGIFARLFGR